MKLLLDEDLPHNPRHELVGHAEFAVACMAWQGIENGELLHRAAENGFDAVLTMDAGIAYEQNLASLATTVVMLEAASNTLDDLRPLIPKRLAALPGIQPRTLIRVE